MINKTVLEYRSAISKAEIIIRNMKEIGVNTSSYQEELNSIINEVEKEESLLSSTGYSQRNNFNKVYQVGIDKAKKLLFDLEKYNKYNQAINKCYYIQGTQNILEYSKEELSVNVDNIIDLLTIIKDFDVFLENDKYMIEKLYEVIYGIIKLEFSYSGNSKLLDYCKKNEADATLISKCIIDDVDALKESKYDINKINFLMTKIASQNGQNLYLDDELVQLICISNNKEEYLEEISKSLQEIKYILGKNKGDLKNLIDRRSAEIEEKDNRVASNKVFNSRQTKDIIVSIIPIVMAISSAVTCYYFTIKAVVGTDYKTDVLTYSSSTGKTISSQEYTDRLTDTSGKTTDNLVTIETLGIWRKTSSSDSDSVYFERLIEKTKIEGSEFDDLSKYLDLDLESTDLDFKYEADVERKTSLSPEDMYKDSITEVVKEHQYEDDAKNGEYADAGEAFLTNFLAFMVAVLGITISELLLLGFSAITSGYYELFDSIETLISELSDIRYYNSDVSENIKKIKSLSEKIKAIIDNNAEIKSKMSDLLNRPEYKVLFDDNKKDISEIEKYIKEMESDATLSLNKKV